VLVLKREKEKGLKNIMREKPGNSPRERRTPFAHASAEARHGSQRDDSVRRKTFLFLSFFF